MTKKRETRKQVTFTTSKGRGSFELRSGADDVLHAEVKQLTKSLADAERNRTSVPSGTLRRVKSLPSYIQEHYVKWGLIEGTKSQKVPTLGVFLDQYFASRADKSQEMHKRLRVYLVECFGEHTRIDLITRADAAGIKDYLKNKRKKSQGKKGGCLSDTTIDRFVTSMRHCFKTAVAWGYLPYSPFDNVEGGGHETNKARHYHIELFEFNRAMSCLDDIEQRGILAFARWGGLRIPSEILHLKFADFRFENDGTASFRVLKGKTGERIVPFFEDLRPYYEALKAAVLPDQEYLFPKYRRKNEKGNDKFSNVGTLIRKQMVKAGLPVWEQFFVNCRRSCIRDKREAGYTESERTAIFGNSKMVRAAHYDGERSREQIAALCRPPSCRPSGNTGVPYPVDVPAVPVRSGNSAESEPFDVSIFHFGLPNHEKFYPTLFPTLPSDSSSVWEMIDNGARPVEVIVAALLRVGYSGKAAWRIAEHDRYAWDFYTDLIYCRERIYDYQMQQISHVEMLGSVVAFCFKNLRRAWQGSIISKEALSVRNLDKMAGIDKVEDIAPAPMRMD